MLPTLNCKLFEITHSNSYSLSGLSSSNATAGGSLHCVYIHTMTCMNACFGGNHCMSRIPLGTAAIRYLWSVNGLQATGGQDAGHHCVTTIHVGRSVCSICYNKYSISEHRSSYICIMYQVASFALLSYAFICRCEQTGAGQRSLTNFHLCSCLCNMVLDRFSLQI